MPPLQMRGTVVIELASRVDLRQSRGRESRYPDPAPRMRPQSAQAGFVVEPEEPVDLLAVPAKPARQLRPPDPSPWQRIKADFQRRQQRQFSASRFTRRAWNR